jgi:tubulin--tyrosine ligase
MDNKPLFFVSWAAAPLTESLVRKSLLSYPNIDSGSICSTLPSSYKKLIQWSTYDEIDHALTHSDHQDVLSSSFVIRKALIRKHYLSRCIHSYLTKYPGSVLQTAVPKTWEIEISFADDLDDLWADELWDLSDVLDESIASPKTDDRWWILKPGMADRGMGIRLFNSKGRLRRILEGFDDDCQSSDGDGNADGDGAAASTDNTSIAISQLRHFVIQASGASLFRYMFRYGILNTTCRNTYQVLFCLIREKLPWEALHARLINWKAIRFVTLHVDCSGMVICLTRFDN